MFGGILRCPDFSCAIHLNRALDLHYRNIGAGRISATAYIFCDDRFDLAVDRDRPSTGTWENKTEPRAQTHNPTRTGAPGRGLQTYEYRSIYNSSRRKKNGTQCLVRPRGQCVFRHRLSNAFSSRCMQRICRCSPRQCFHLMTRLPVRYDCCISWSDNRNDHRQIDRKGKPAQQDSIVARSCRPPGEHRQNRHEEKDDGMRWIRPLPSVKERR